MDGPEDRGDSECLCLFDHNLIQLVHDWRFLQTSPADPDARKVILDEDVLGDCIRYVVSHEVGHCLALMHNMSGSAAIPTDSLRSPSFTQKIRDDVFDHGLCPE